MSFFILQEHYLLRGYSKLPFALVHPNYSNTEFFTKDEYKLVLDCDGNTDIDYENLSERQKTIFRNMLNAGIIRQCEKGETLNPEQEYILYPSKFKARVQWSITGRCNYLCKHCFLSAPSYKGSDVSLEKCIRILDQLCECGIYVVAVTGGEPLVHNGFYQLLEEIRKRDMKLEVIYTNCALVDNKLLDKLDELELHPSFNVSFDGIGCHDWLRGIDGAEQKTIDTIKLLKQRGFSVTVSMSLHKGNISSLPETVRLLGELGCSHLKTSGMNMQGNWIEQRDNYLSNKELFDYLIDYIPQYFKDGAPISMQMGLALDYDNKRKKARIPAVIGGGNEKAGNNPICGVISNDLYIGADGKVLPCMSFAGHPLEKKFESVFDMDLKDIINDSYYSSVAKVSCKECIEHNKKCTDCKYRWLCCSGCRAGACDNNRTDYYAIDESYCTFFENGYYEKVLGLIKEYIADSHE